MRKKQRNGSVLSFVMKIWIGRAQKPFLSRAFGKIATQAKKYFTLFLTQKIFFWLSIFWGFLNIKPCREYFLHNFFEFTWFYPTFRAVMVQNQGRFLACVKGLYFRAILVIGIFSYFWDILWENFWTILSSTQSLELCFYYQSPVQ